MIISSGDFSTGVIAVLFAFVLFVLLQSVKQSTDFFDLMLDFRHQGIRFQVQSGANAAVVVCIIYAKTTGGRDKAHMIAVERSGSTCPIPPGNAAKPGQPFLIVCPLKIGLNLADKVCIVVINITQLRRGWNKYIISGTVNVATFPFLVRHCGGENSPFKTF